MSSNINVLQVIPKLGYGGAETGCYDIAHYLPENNCKSFIVTSGGELIKFIDKEKVKLIRLPVHSKNPFLSLGNNPGAEKEYACVIANGAVVSNPIIAAANHLVAAHSSGEKILTQVPLHGSNLVST